MIQRGVQLYLQRPTTSAGVDDNEVQREQLVWVTYSEMTGLMYVNFCRLIHVADPEMTESTTCILAIQPRCTQAYEIHEITWAFCLFLVKVFPDDSNTVNENEAKLHV